MVELAGCDAGGRGGGGIGGGGGVREEGADGPGWFGEEGIDV